MPEKERLGPRLPYLKSRHWVSQSVRDYFVRAGFLEVTMPTLVACAVSEPNIDAVQVTRGRFLSTSPEFQMKRLLAGGVGPIYSVGPCFREAEVGSHHNVEFTMLEWYRDKPALADVEADVKALIARSIRVLQEHGLPSKPIDKWQRVSVSQLCRDVAGVDIHGSLSTDELIARCQAAALDTHDSKTWSDCFYSVFVDHIDPWLASQDGGVIVYDWPLPVGALARAKSDDPHTVERFEAYVHGVELANAFGELTDAPAQRARFLNDNEVRKQLGKATVAIDEKFLEALQEGLPPCAGCALGVDRLVMVLTGAPTIRSVLTFAADEL